MRRALSWPVGLGIALLAIVAAVLLLPASPAEAQSTTTVVTHGSPIVPSGLNPGDQFRVLFVTSTTRDATSTDIAVYNSFIQTRAAAGHTDIRPFSSLFKVLGSTSAVSAKNNTGTTGTGVPIYWLTGDKAADDYADFYDGSWDSVAARDESGTGVTTNIAEIFTGSNSNGDSSTSAPLGRSVVPTLSASGSISGLSTDPLNQQSTTNTASHRFYGLSPVLTVGTPPSTVSVSVTPTSVTEGDSGFTDHTVNVTITRTTNAGGNADRVRLCLGGSATRGTTGGADYSATIDGSIEFGSDGCTPDTSAGAIVFDSNILEVLTTLKLRVYGDTRGEQDGERDETVTLRLAPVSGSSGTLSGTTLSPTPATVTIKNDDYQYPPVMFLEMPAYYVNEGDSGHRDYPLKVHLSKPLAGNIDYRLHFQGNASKGTDYEIYVGTGNTVFPNGGTTQMAAGDQVQHYRIRVFGDTDDESYEHLSIRMSKGGLRPETWGVPFLYSSDRYEKSQGRALIIRPHSGEVDYRNDFPGPYFEKSNRRLFQFRDHGGSDFNVAWWGYATGPDHTIQLTEGGPSRSYGFRVSDDYTPDVSGEVLRMRPLFGNSAQGKLECSWDNVNWRGCAGLLTRDLDRRDGVPADSPIVPPGLSPGDKFRLLFVTSTTRDATSTDIADYNSFVQGRAAAGHDDIRPLSSLFRVLGSTTAVSAKTNTGTTGTGVPVYWVNGDKAADDYADFYDGNWDSSSARDEDGAAVTTNIDRIFTGTTNDGSSNLSAALGGGTLPNFASVGSLSGSIHSPLANAVDSNTSTRRFYGLSPVLTVGAGPSEATLHIRAIEGRYLGDEEFDIRQHRFASSKYGMSRTQVTSGWIRVRVTDCTTCPEPHRQDGPGRMTFHGSKSDAESGSSPISSLTLKKGEVKDYWVRLLANFRGGTPGTVTPRNTELARLQFMDVSLNSRANGANIDAFPGDNFFLWGARYGSHYPDAVSSHNAYAGPKRVRVRLKGDAECHTNSDTVTHAVHGDGPAFTGATLTLNYVCPRVSFASASGSKMEHEGAVKNGGLTKDGQPLDLTETTRFGRTWEIRLSQYEVPINISPAPTEDINLWFRYYGSADYFRMTHTPVITETRTWTDQDGNERTIHFRETWPYTGDFWIGYDGTDRPCRAKAGEGAHANSLVIDDRRNCGLVDGMAWIKEPNNGHFFLITRIPAGTTQKTLKIFIWDDDVHDSGETVTLELLRNDGYMPAGGNTRVTEGMNYALGSQTTHTLTILNEEPAPSAAPLADPHAPDLDAPAPAQASTEVLYTGDVLVGWPDYAGESKVHIRARSANGHGTKWGYNQEGNWHLMKGLQPGTWIIEVLKTDFATKLSEMLVTQVPEAKDLPAEPEPVVNITTAETLVIEGQPAEFTVSSSPPPKSPLTVSLTVSQGGDYAASGATGTKSITIPITGSITHSVPTLDDAADENNGSVTVAVSGGDGYTVGVSPSVTVDVADNDDPPPAKPVKPTVSVAAGSGVEEGETATFTINANPASASPLIVYFTVSGEGDYAVADVTGEQAVIIQSGGSASFNIPTVDDGVAELDGSFTVKLSQWEDYTVGKPSTATVKVSDDDRTASPTPDPVVSISGGSGVTEGGAATFTVSASPAPASSLTVALTVSQSGDYAASGTTGTKSVTVPTTGSATYSVPTVNDAADEADGSVTVAVSGGSGYTVGTSYTATVAVSDDDATPQQQPEPKQPATPQDGPDLDAPAPTENTATVLSNGDVLFGWPVTQSEPNYFIRAISYDGHGHLTKYDYAKQWYVFENLPAGRWVFIVYDMVARQSVGGWLDLNVPERPAAQDNTPTPTPAVSIAAGSGVTEGGTATFTVSASPAPTAPLTVSLTVSQSGDYATSGSTGTKSVTVPTSGSTTYSVATVDDTADEADGSVTVAISNGQGYSAGSPATATVSVADNDMPAVSIAAGSNITEGGTATFTVSANPTPHAALSVSVSVAQSGDFGATTGAQNVTIPTSGTATLSVATGDDATDEAHGSITATVSGGSGYTIGTPSTATVSVSDNDDSPAQTPVVSIAAGAGITEGGSASFTVSASPAPTSPLAVSLSVTQNGDYAASGTTGTKSVTVPTSGSVTYTVATTDDSADETDGSVSIAVSSGNGYSVGSPSSATVNVADNDDPPTPSSCVTTDADLVSQVEAKVERHTNETGREDLKEMFSRSLATMKGQDTYTTADIKARPDKQGDNWQGPGPNPLWQKIYSELDRLETCRASE